MIFFWVWVRVQVLHFPLIIEKNNNKIVESSKEGLKFESKKFFLKNYIANSFHLRFLYNAGIFGEGRKIYIFFFTI